MGNRQSKRSAGGAGENTFFEKHRGLRAFLITFACCAAAFSFAAAVLLGYMGAFKDLSGLVFENEAGRVLGSSREPVSKPGGFTMLICVYSDGDGEPVEFILYRLDGEKGRTVIVPLSEKLAVNCKGEVMALRDLYKKSGISTAKACLENFLNAQIDYTCTIGSGNFLKIFEKLGGLYESVPENLALTLPGSARQTRLQASPRQYLSGEKIYILIASPSYSSDAQRYREQSILMKEFAAEKFTGLYMKNAPAYYGEIFNYVDTDFSMNDLLKSKETIMGLSSADSVETPLPSYSKTAKGLYKMANADNIKRFFQ